MERRHLVGFAAGLCALLCLIGTASAASIVYDSLADASNWGYAPRPYEIGDKITLAGTERHALDFTFSYHISSSFDTGAETAVVTFYDFVGGAPGSALFVSAPISLTVGSHDYTVTDIGVNLPDTIVWTVTVGNLNPTTNMYYTGPILGSVVVGSSENSFWQDTGSGLAEYTFSTGAAGNFKARLTAIPEPATLILVVVGFLGIGALRRRTRA